jgi:transposase
LHDKDALIVALMARIEALVAENAALVSRVAELEAKLGLPPKTPDNSGVPPSKGQKPSGSSAPKSKARPHAGAHRLLHSNPTSKREVQGIPLARLTIATACQMVPPLGCLL